MNATKRKFNALIQGMGTHKSTSSLDLPSTASLDDLTSTSLDRAASGTSTMSPARDMGPPVSQITKDFLAKRRRVSALGSTTGNEIGTTGKTTISNIVLKKTGSKGDTVIHLDPPKYCPGDREQLIRRLATFQELTEWTPKQDAVSEIEWAKRGWICHGKDRVRCALCNKEIVVKTRKQEVEGKEVPVEVGSQVEQGLVKRFAELIVEGHSEDCLWRRRGCDSSLLRLRNITNPAEALSTLRYRYDELCDRQSFLPYLFNLRLPESFSLETVKSQLPKDFFTSPPPKSTTTTSTTANPPSSSSTSLPLNDVSLTLSLFGWQGLIDPRIGAVPNSATCTTCLRRLGLWMFKSREVDPSTNEVLVPAPMDHLDPVREHRFFCPWRNAHTQRNPGSRTSVSQDKAGWEILVQTVRNAAYLRGDLDESKSKHKHTKSHGSTASTGDTEGTLPMLGPDMVNDDDEEDESVREAKDKERWARLRRVKTLFDTKNGKKLRRMVSRPSSRASRPDTGASAAPSIGPGTGTGTGAAGQ